MNINSPNVALRRTDRLLRERTHDPYKLRSKLREPTVCPECRAVFREGRWQWMESWPYDANQYLCQACQRIRDHYPVGVIQFGGGFVPAHKEEIRSLIRHLGDGETKEHPLHRIMSVAERPGAIVVNTTDIHLPHSIGHALHKSFQGNLDFRYEEETYFIRVNWRRED